MSEQDEWTALLNEALMIPEPAADKHRRLMHLQRDILTEAPPECADLSDRIDIVAKGLCANA